MIRAAGPADASVVTALQARAWRRAYADFVPEEAMPQADAGRVERWGQIIARGPAKGASTLVWDQDGVVAGFVCLGPARDAKLPGAAGELRAVYVDPPAQGAGVGRALMDAGEARLREDGYAYAVLWVFAADGMARDLYARRGWVLEPHAVNERLARWAPGVRYRLAL